MAGDLENLGVATITYSDTNTDAQQLGNLAAKAGSMVNNYSNYLTNMTALRLQQKQIDKLNSWTELQKDIEIRNIEDRTGALVGAQTAAYGFSGVGMSGSALDVTLNEMARGAEDKIYAEINFQYGEIQRNYQKEMAKAAERQEKTMAIASGISSVTSMASGGK